MAKKAEKTEEVQVPAPAPIRTKFQCVSLRDFSDDQSFKERIHMHPVNGDNLDGTPNENKSLSKGMLSGVIELLIDNPDMKGVFATGKVFRVDFTEVPAT